MITKLNDIKDVGSDYDNLTGWGFIEGKPTMKTKILHTNNKKI